MNVNPIQTIRVVIQTRLQTLHIMIRMRDAHIRMRMDSVARSETSTIVINIPTCIHHRPFRVVVQGVHRR